MVLRRRRGELGLPRRHGPVRDGVAGARPGARDGRERSCALRRAHDPAAPVGHRARVRALRAPGPGGMFDAVDLQSARDARKRLEAYAGGRCGAPQGRVLVGHQTWRQGQSNRRALRSRGYRRRCARSCATIPRACSSPKTSTPSTGYWPASWWPRRPGGTCHPATAPHCARPSREERWGDAVFAFIARTGTAVDVYESTELHAAAEAAVGPLELQLTPLFAE